MGISIVINVLFLIGVAVLSILYFRHSTSSQTSTTTTTTTQSSSNTTSQSTASGVTLGPDKTDTSWHIMGYSFQTTPHNTFPQQRQQTQYNTLNQQFVLSNGFNAYVENDNASPPNMDICMQGNTGTGNTLVVYKNGTYWYAANTAVEFGPNLTTAFKNVQIGLVLASLKRNQNNLALITGIVSPTSPYTTLVSGTYSVDAAMLNLSSQVSPMNYITWFYGGTIFPYAYTLTSFAPATNS